MTAPDIDYFSPAALQAAYRWSWTPGEGFWAGGRHPFWVPEQEPPTWEWQGPHPTTGADR